MNLIFALRRVYVQTRHFKNARVHLFVIEEAYMIALRDAAGVSRPFLTRRALVVPFIVGGDVCVR